MTEAELLPLLSTSHSAKKSEKKGKKEKKEKKKEKKRSRDEMEEEEEEVEDQVVQQTKSNGVEESTATKKEKSKVKSDHVCPQQLTSSDCQDGKKKKRKIAEAEDVVKKVTKDDGLDKKAERKLEKKKAKLEARAAKKAKKVWVGFRVSFVVTGFRQTCEGRYTLY